MQQPRTSRRRGNDVPPSPQSPSGNTNNPNTLKPTAGTMVQLEAFSDTKFNPKTLVDSITARAFLTLSRSPLGIGAGSAPSAKDSGASNQSVRSAGRNLGDFDPDPLLHAFQRVAEDLRRYRRTVQKDLGVLEDECSSVESTYRNSLQSLGGSFSGMQGSFDTLEARVSEVANTAVRIGEQLETIDKQRARATVVRELLWYFMDFNMGVTDRLDSLRRFFLLQDTTGADASQRQRPPSPTAEASSSVLPNARDSPSSAQSLIDVAIIVRRLIHIARHVDAPGTEQARLNIEKYGESFETDLLARFHDGTEARDTTVMKLCADTLLEFNGGESCVRAWINKHKLFTTPPPVVQHVHDDPDVADPGFVRLLVEFRETVYNEWDLICAVFPSPQVLLTSLIPRFFQQLVQGYVEQILEHSSKVSDIFYLKSLAATLSAANNLVEEMAQFDEKMLKNKFVVTTIERCIDDVFSQFNNTTEREQRHLDDIIAGVFNEANGFYSTRRQAKKSSLFARVQKPAAAVPIVVLDQIFTPDCLIKILGVHTAAVKRCVLLHSEPYHSVSKLYISLCRSVYSTYVDPALECRIEDLQAFDGKGEPDMKPLQTVQTTSKITHLMQCHFENLMVPVLLSNLAVLRSSIDAKTAMIMTMEAKCNCIVMQLATQVVQYLGQCLSKQKKTDFKEKESSTELEVHTSSATCVTVCAVLEMVLQNVRAYLDGENANLFLRQIGVHCHIMLLEHFKKFPVTSTGVLILSRDLANYQEAVAKFKIPDLNLRFSFLRELGNLFLVRPENLVSLLEEGLLASLDRAVIFAYLSNRADFKTAHIGRLLRPKGSNRSSPGFDEYYEDDGFVGHQG